MDSGVRTALLTGTIGVGKTSLAEAMSEVLHAHGIRHALIDLDWLGQVYPAPDSQDLYSMKLQLANLRAMWPNFRSVGIKNALLAATIVTSEQLQGLRHALPGAHITVVRMIASPSMIRDRLSARDKGRLLADFLARTDQLAADIEAAGIDDLVVSNDEPSLPEVAKETLQRLSWLERD